ncbi:hypothetical protein SAMN05877809_11523 [Rhodobacter sp. JA431]|nr:hypothetical protein SAMN05877809_11523 [Rhodobacter sp. JA431]
MHEIEFFFNVIFSMQAMLEQGITETAVRLRELVWKCGFGIGLGGILKAGDSS